MAAAEAVLTITPRSPSSGSSVIIPAAARVRQRNVPTVFSRNTHSNLSLGKMLISPVALSRRTVEMAFPPPAQHTSARS